MGLRMDHDIRRRRQQTYMNHIHQLQRSPRDMDSHDEPSDTSRRVNSMDSESSNEDSVERRERLCSWFTLLCTGLHQPGPRHGFQRLLQRQTHSSMNNFTPPITPAEEKARPPATGCPPTAPFSDDPFGGMSQILSCHPPVVAVKTTSSVNAAGVPNPFCHIAEALHQPRMLFSVHAEVQIILGMCTRQSHHQQLSWDIAQILHHSPAEENRQLSSM